MKVIRLGRAVAFTDVDDYVAELAKVHDPSIVRRRRRRKDARVCLWAASTVCGIVERAVTTDAPKRPRSVR